MRVVLKTAPLEQWAVAREMRQRIKYRFDHEGIAMQVPQRLFWQQGPGQQVPASRPPLREQLSRSTQRDLSRRGGRGGSPPGGTIVDMSRLVDPTICPDCRDDRCDASATVPGLRPARSRVRWPTDLWTA